MLRELGHDVVVRDTDYRPTAMYGQVLPRYFRGVYDDVRTLPHQERLDSRTRGFARIGGLFSDARIAEIRAAEEKLSARVLSIFDDVDVVITPGAATGPSRIGAYRKRGAVSTLALVAAGRRSRRCSTRRGSRRRSCRGDWTATGLPMSIQLVGRPFDEATLLSLAPRSRRTGRGRSAARRSA